MLSQYFPHYLWQEATHLANYPFVPFELLGIMLMPLTSCTGGDSEQLLQTDFPFRVFQISIIPSLGPFPRSTYCLDIYYLVPFLGNKAYPCGFPSALSATKRPFSHDEASPHILCETTLSSGRARPKEVL